MQPKGSDRAVILILLIGEASGVFAGFCPSWFTVASPFFHEQEAKAGNVKRIRWGEIAATLIVLATGGAVSYQQRDPFPLAASVLISGVFIAGYEYQIRHPSTEDDPAGSPPPATGLERTPATGRNGNGSAAAYPWNV
jgi:hypothetical protein